VGFLIRALATLRAVPADRICGDLPECFALLSLAACPASIHDSVFRVPVGFLCGGLADRVYWIVRHYVFPPRAMKNPDGRTPGPFRE
jgi:hypothetical protein